MLPPLIDDPARLPPSPHQEKKIARADFAKCAWRLVPLILVLYFVSYQDGLNVAFAAQTIVIALMLIALVAAVLIMERAAAFQKRKIGTILCERRALKAIADGGARPPTSTMGGHFNRSAQHFTFEKEVKCDATATEATFLYGGGEC